MKEPGVAETITTSFIPRIGFSTSEIADDKVLRGTLSFQDRGHSLLVESLKIRELDEASRRRSGRSTVGKSSSASGWSETLVCSQRMAVAAQSGRSPRVRPLVRPWVGIAAAGSSLEVQLDRHVADREHVADQAQHAAAPRTVATPPAKPACLRAASLSNRTFSSTLGRRVQ